MTIAGSDSSGGAGLQADLKTFHRFGVYGTSAVTLVTAQNTTGVDAVETMPPALVSAQILAVARDLPVAAAKTGALGGAAIVEAVSDALAACQPFPLVVDPVLVTKHGDALLDAAGVDALQRRLLPRAVLLTPNAPEASALLGGGVIESERDLDAAARALQAQSATAVLLKGGHLPGNEVVDLFFDGHTLVSLRAPRIDTVHTHGTGCTLSAAITAHLALGSDLEGAVRAAVEFVRRAIAAAPGLGRGQGPLNHWV